MPLKYVNSGAEISADGRYRYLLWREWRRADLIRPSKWRYWDAVDGDGHRLGEPVTCWFIMLNPSTADASLDDPTIRRCVGFAQSWQYDRMAVLNLFAYRTKSPAALKALTHTDDPVGSRNQQHFIKINEGDKLVCAWGLHGDYLGQDQTVLGWMDPDMPKWCLGTTKSGQPRHPLFLSADTKLVPFK